MAGNYPDVPAARMSYDRDGSTVAHISSGGVVSTYGAGTVTDFNREIATSRAVIHSTFSGNNNWGILFPEPRDINAYHITWDSDNGTGISLNQVEYSTNTTTLADGTWTTIHASFGNTYIGIGGPTNVIALRNSITSTGLITGVKALRWNVSSGGNAASDNFRLCLMHLYGAPSAGQAPNRLRFWLPATNAEVGGAYMDWGNVPASTTINRDIRVKNPSATLTANDVVLSSEALTPGSPSHASMHTFSTDNVNFFSSLNIGNLAPGAISAVVRVRRTTTAGSQLSLWWTRIVAQAGSWT